MIFKTTQQYSISVIAVGSCAAICLTMMLCGCFQSIKVEFEEAIQRGDNVHVESLLRSHPTLVKVNLGERKGDKLSPLGLAAGLGNEGICKHLIAAGSDVNARDKYGLTPLHRAVRSGMPAIVQLLIASGADPNQRTIDGRSPLDFAMTTEMKDAFRGGAR